MRHIEGWETEERPWLAAASGRDDPREVYSRYAFMRAVEEGDLPDDSTEDGRKRAIARLVKLKAETRARYPLH